MSFPISLATNWINKRQFFVQRKKWTGSIFPTFITIEQVHMHSVVCSPFCIACNFVTTTTRLLVAAQRREQQEEAQEGQNVDDGVAALKRKEDELGPPPSPCR